MNREYRFRAKLNNEDVWVYGGGVQQIGENTVMLSLDESGQLVIYQIVPITIGEFTSLLDTNKVEIYEGDVMKSHSWNPPKMEVRFVEGVFCLCHREYFVDIHYATTEFEVIGNIYDNPSLLWN